MDTYFKCIKERNNSFENNNSQSSVMRVNNCNLENLEDSADAKDLKFALENDRDEPISWKRAKEGLFR